MDNDLISRSALLDGGVRVQCGYNLDGLVAIPMRDVRKSIKEAPAVDAVVLPCKIGQTVWTIRRYHDKKLPQEGIVSEMFFTRQMKLVIVVKNVSRGEWGKDVFATREEVEAALEERKMNNAAD